MTVAVGQLLAGKYRVERELGRGGMGVVFLAENTAIGRKVALKVLLPDAAEDEGMVERFRQEARAAAAIGHPGIVDVLDLGRSDDGDEFIVMEFLRGESLRDWLEREEQLSVRDTVETMLPLIDALAAAHARGIVHRDLKPDNIFIAHEPTRAVKILDFGISKLLTRNADEALTATGAVMGTPHYMPPEQARGLRELGPAADVYALGAIIYRVLVGEPMFSGAYTEVLLKLISATPPALSDARRDAPAALTELVGQLVAKSPDERPSLDVVTSRLEAILAGLPERAAEPVGSATSDSRAKHAPITPRRGPISASIAEDDTVAPGAGGELGETLPPEPLAPTATSATPAPGEPSLTASSTAALFAPSRRLLAGSAVALISAGLLVWLVTRQPKPTGADQTARGARDAAVVAADSASAAADGTSASAADTSASAADTTSESARRVHIKPDMNRPSAHNKPTRHKTRTKTRRGSRPKTKTKTKTPAKSDDIDKPKTKIRPSENLFHKKSSQP